MKKVILILVLFCNFLLITAQVGINTATPQATLDVALPNPYVFGSKAGISVPILTPAQIINMNTAGLKEGTMVYCETPDETTVIKTQGYWFWKSGRWQTLTANAPKFFYAPSVPINTATTTVNLYNIYKTQFETPMVASTGASGKIPFHKEDELEYYVTWYDNTIFTNVKISNTGVLTYSLTGVAPSKPTYMNIVFVVKP